MAAGWKSLLEEEGRAKRARREKEVGTQTQSVAFEAKWASESEDSSGDESPKKCVSGSAETTRRDEESSGLHLRPHASKKEIARVDRQANRVSELLGMAVSKGTAEGYEAVLKSVIPMVEKENGRQVLPMATWGDFVAVFCELDRFWPTVEGKNGRRVVRWNSVKKLYAAVKFWHTVRGKQSILDHWDDRMKRLWQGLERDSSHIVSEKLPLGVDSVRMMLQRGAEVGKSVFDKSSEGRIVDKKELLKIRNAAAVAVAFFGTRRQAEVAALRLGNCTRDQGSGRWNIWVESQKNDQMGIGQMCVIPRMEVWGEACPTEVIQLWFRVRQGPLMRMDRLGRLSDRAVSRIPGQSPKDILFPSLSGKFWGLEASAQALTNAVRRETGLEVTPSARKGGAQFYLAHGMGERATQVQAGWKTPKSLQQVYGKTLGAELRTAVSTAAEQAGRVWETRNWVTKMLGTSFYDSAGQVDELGSKQVSDLLKEMKRAEPLISREFLGEEKGPFLEKLKEMVKACGVKGDDRKMCARVYQIASQGESTDPMSREEAARAAALERAAA